MQRYVDCKNASFAIALTIGAITMATAALADAAGYNYRAYCHNHRYSPHGWLTERHMAKAAADEHRRQFPGHNVTVQRRKR